MSSAPAPAPAPAPAVDTSNWVAENQATVTRRDARLNLSSTASPTSFTAADATPTSSSMMMKAATSRHIATAFTPALMHGSPPVVASGGDKDGDILLRKVAALEEEIRLLRVDASAAPAKAAPAKAAPTAAASGGAKKPCTMTPCNMHPHYDHSVCATARGRAPGPRNDMAATVAGAVLLAGGTAAQARAAARAVTPPPKKGGRGK